MKVNRLINCGHTEMMKEYIQTKNVYTKKIIGEKARGRPRQRWRHSVKKDLLELGITFWIEK
jgi:hypothetical protein